MQTKQPFATDSEREDAEREVLFPETADRTHTLVLENPDGGTPLKYTIKLRALPILFARRVNKALGPFRNTMKKLVQDGAVPKSEDDLDLDDLTIDSLLKATDTLREYYKLPYEMATIEERITLGDLVRFIKAQLEVSDKNDFLLNALRAIIGVSDLAEKATEELQNASAQISPSAPPSASPGESPSTSSSGPTPTVS